MALFDNKYCKKLLMTYVSPVIEIIVVNNENIIRTSPEVGDLWPWL